LEGISLPKSQGAIKDSVIKLNYIFTISNEMVSKFILHLSKEKSASYLRNWAKNLKASKHNFHVLSFLVKPLNSLTKDQSVGVAPQSRTFNSAKDH
jgi:hypothetical protein